MLVKRNQILDLLSNNLSFISTHEHIGNETLFFNNASSYTYKQTLVDLFNNYNQSNINFNYKLFASVVTTMPYYIQYKIENIPSNLFSLLNEPLINDCAKWFSSCANKIPLPFISIDLNTSILDLELFLKNVKYPIMGFKLHPPARMNSIESISDSSLIDFFEETRLPILLHCSRKGIQSDFDDIYRNLLLKIQNKNIIISIAHSAFLSDNINCISDFDNIYIDIAPWSVIIDSVYQTNEFEFCVDKLLTLIERFPNKILYGGDTPFDVQIWQDKSKHGSGLNFDLSVIQSIDNRTLINIFYNNPLNYLFGKKCAN